MITAAVPAAAHSAAPALQMIGPHATAAVAAAGSAVPILNMTGILALLGGILAISMFTAAIRFSFHAHRGNIPAVLTGLAVLAGALFVWGVAHGNLNNLGSTIAHTISNL